MRRAGLTPTVPSPTRGEGNWSMDGFVLRASRAKRGIEAHVVDELEPTGKEERHTERGALDSGTRHDRSKCLSETANQSGEGDGPGTFRRGNDRDDVRLASRDVHLRQAEAREQQPNRPGQ